QGVSIRSIAKKLGRSPASAAQVDFQAEEGAEEEVVGVEPDKILQGTSTVRQSAKSRSAFDG
ncbi:MAG: hypothetical protein AAB823_00625, partial [Patescibacteria group bacterium]